MKKKKRLRHGTKAVLFASMVLAVLICVIGVQISSLYIKNQQLEEKIIKIQEQLAEEQEKQVELLKEREFMKTNEYIEQIAREKFGLVKPNEIIFVPINEED